MRATLIHAPRDIRVEDVPDPEIRRPTDAVVRVVAACVCGSDLWPYRGVTETNEPHRIGHEFVGIVEELGSEVTGLRKGDFVIAPFVLSDGTCRHCRNGVHTSCAHGAWWGGEDADGAPDRRGAGPGGAGADGRRDAGRDAGAAGRVDGRRPADAVRRDGHRSPRRARRRRRPGSTVVVVGDGAVGQCGVIAAKRLGAERIIAMSRHADRQALAQEFGATDIVAERGDDGVARVAGAAGRDRRGLGAGVRRHQGVHAAGAGRHPSRRPGRVRRRAGRRLRAADPPAVRRQHRGGRRGGAGPRLPPRAARRRAVRGDRPGPGLRPRAPAGAGAGGVRRDGRAPVDQDDAAAVRRSAALSRRAGGSARRAPSGPPRRPRRPGPRRSR